MTSFSFYCYIYSCRDSVNCVENRCWREIFFNSFLQRSQNFCAINLQSCYSEKKNLEQKKNLQKHDISLVLLLHLFVQQLHKLCRKPLLQRNTLKKSFMWKSEPLSHYFAIFLQRENISKNAFKKRKPFLFYCSIYSSYRFGHCADDCCLKRYSLTKFYMEKLEDFSHQFAVFLK